MKPEGAGDDGECIVERFQDKERRLGRKNVDRGGLNVGYHELELVGFYHVPPDAL